MPHEPDAETRPAAPARQAVLIRSWVLVAIAILGVSLSAPVTAAAVVPALAIAFWRTGLGSLATLPWAIGWLSRARRQGGTVALLRQLRGSVLAGVMLAVHFMLWLPSLRFTSVAAATALVSTFPVWSMLADRFSGRPVGRRVLVGIAIAMSGIVAITGVDVGRGTHAALGDLLALLGGIAVVGYFWIGERQQAHVSAAAHTAVTYGTAALVTLPVCLLFGTALGGFSARGWLEILVITVAAQLLGHTLLNIAVPVVGATPMSLALLLEVPGAMLIAWAWYGLEPPLVILPGAALVLVGLVLVVSGRGQQGPAAADATEPVW